MTIPINSLNSALAQLQAMAAQAASDESASANQADAAAGGTFAAALKSSLDKVSDDQKTAVGEAQAFELGASNVSLSDVMIDGQKANLGFQFSLQVRNRLVSAYQDLMQIQV